MQDRYRLTTLPNGARVVTAQMPHMHSTCVGFWAGVGGRHERASHSGISHFLEHLLFKGTERRNARQISADVEGVGGYLNAFTTEDHTCFYARAEARHFPRMCDVLGDMYLDSVFPEHEIEREREVIREEILMYRDQPAQHVQELLTETMWPRHPIGRALTGTVQTISGLKREHFVDFRQRNYSTRNTVVSLAGPITHEDALAVLRPLLERLPKGRAPRFQPATPSDAASAVSLYSHDTEQTHLALGFHAFGRHDERRYALKLASVILGENMSSRLFQSLRERHGLCYNVASSIATLEDAGSLAITAGVDPDLLKKSLRMILAELDRLGRRAPGKAELQQAKDYSIGQSRMSLESTSNQAMFIGESLLAYDHIPDPVEIENKLMAVTAEEIRAVTAHCLHRANLALSIVGPQKDREEIERWLA